MARCPKCHKHFAVLEDEDDGQHGCPHCGYGETSEPLEPDADYLFENHGSVYLCRPTSGKAFAWLHEHTVDGQWLGDALAVEPRFVDSLATSLEDDGWSTKI